MEVGEEVEDVLQLVEDGVVHGQLARDHLLEVVSDVLQVLEEALQGVELAADPLAQSSHRLVLYVPSVCSYADLGYCVLYI